VFGSTSFWVSKLREFLNAVVFVPQENGGVYLGRLALLIGSAISQSVPDYQVKSGLMRVCGTMVIQMQDVITVKASRSKWRIRWSCSAKLGNVSIRSEYCGIFFWVSGDLSNDRYTLKSGSLGGNSPFQGVVKVLGNRYNWTRCRFLCAIRH